MGSKVSWCAGSPRSPCVLIAPTASVPLAPPTATGPRPSRALAAARASASRSGALNPRLNSRALLQHVAGAAGASLEHCPVHRSRYLARRPRHAARRAAEPNARRPAPCDRRPDCAAARQAGNQAAHCGWGVDLIDNCVWLTLVLSVYMCQLQPSPDIVSWLSVAVA